MTKVVPRAIEFWSQELPSVSPQARQANEAMVDQNIKWLPGSDRHPFQRVADLSLKIAGRNHNLRYRLFKLFGEEAEKGTSAAAIYESVWETIKNLADDVLDEAIGVVYDEPIDEPKAKAATAA